MSFENSLDVVIFDNKNFLLSLYPEIYLSIGFCLLLFFFVIYDFLFDYKVILSKLGGKLSILVLFYTLFLLFNSGFFSFNIFNSLLVVDSYISFSKIFLIFAVIFCILFFFNYSKHEKIVNYEYFILLLLSLLGMMTIISSNSLLTFYLGLELQSLCFYILVAFKPFNNYSTEASLKYFILGAFSSGLLLFGCSLIYGFTGTLNFYDLEQLFYVSGIPDSIYSGVSLGSVFFLIGILFKLAAAPFHVWAPDVYEGAPTIVTAFFAIVPKIAMIVLLTRVVSGFLSQNLVYLNQVIIISGLFSLLVGTFGALYQVKLKRLLAYSAIGHIGFILLAFADFNTNSLFSILFYLFVYVSLSVGLFSILLSIRHVSSNLKIKKISELVLLFKSNSFLAIIFSIILFSIAGIPPLLGFYSKFYVFVSLLKSNLYLIALYASLISVIGSLYYIRLIKLMFFKVFDYHAFYFTVSKANAYLLSFVMLINVFFFFYPSLLVNFLLNLSLYNFY